MRSGSFGGHSGMGPGAAFFHLPGANAARGAAALLPDRPLLEQLLILDKGAGGRAAFRSD